MNKKLWVIVSLVLVVLIAIAVWKSSSSSAATAQNDIAIGQTTSNAVDDKKMQHKTREDILQESVFKQLQALQKNPGNINQFLNEFKLSCVIEDCEMALVKALANYPDQQFARLVQSLLQRLPQYEQQMQSTLMSTSSSPKQRFEQLWTLREQTLGQAEAELGFGQEREYADYRFAYGELKQNPNLSTAQRLIAFDQLQSQYPSPQKESNIGLYEQAVALLDPTPNNLAESERLRHELQQRYLTKAEQVDIQLRDQREIQQQQQANQYQQAVKQLQQEMQPLQSQMSDTEWQKQYQIRLENLRLTMFP